MIWNDGVPILQIYLLRHDCTPGIHHYRAMKPTFDDLSYIGSNIAYKNTSVVLDADHVWFAILHHLVLVIILSRFSKNHDHSIQ